MSVHRYTLQPWLTDVGIVDGKVANRELLISNLNTYLS